MARLGPRILFGLIALTMLLSSPARAQEYNDNIFYLSVFGSFGATPPSGKYDNVDLAIPQSAGGGMNVGYRFGALALESGVQLMKQSWIASYDNGTTPVRELINYDYFSVPFIAKWNYIETRMATFWVKGGMSMDFATSRTNEDLIPVQFVSGIFGIGGTSELSDWAGFLLDISAVQHFGFDSQPNPDVIVSAGFQFALF